MRFTVICIDLTYEVMLWNETSWLAASGNNNQVFCLIRVRKFFAQLLTYNTSEGVYLGLNGRLQMQLLGLRIMFLIPLYRI